MKNIKRIIEILTNPTGYQAVDQCSDEWQKWRNIETAYISWSSLEGHDLGIHYLGHRNDSRYIYIPFQYVIVNTRKK